MKQPTKWIIAILVIIATGSLIYAAWRQPSQPNQASSPNTDTSQSESDQTTTRQLTSTQGVTIELNSWPKDDTVTSPFTITGQVPGSWSNQGVFDIDLLYEGDIGLPGPTARIEGDWMTDELVPFTAELVFPDAMIGDGSNQGTLILRRANPSGSPANDDAATISVMFAK